MTHPMIYLICGSTGAGKTTYAIQLTAKVGAVRFSIDEWMKALFWMDAPHLRGRRSVTGHSHQVFSAKKRRNSPATCAGQSRGVK